MTCYWVVFAGTALVYALLASLHTVTEFDLFWQMATGRWVAQNHGVFSTDVFSYTAAGQPWIYPVGSGLIFYSTYLIGGYKLLSWLGTAVCTGTVALLLRRNSSASAILAIIVIPAFALRSSPRADIFTPLLFAFFLRVLWKRFVTGKGAWWVLPPLMALWVNLHLGFAAGLGLGIAYAAAEAARTLGTDRERRKPGQMRILLAWTMAMLLATLLNPWGWGIYGALLRQNQAMAEHSANLLEWQSIPFDATAIKQICELRDPSGATMWILLLAAIAMLVALVKRQWLAALLLGGPLWLAVKHSRFLVLLACVVVLVGSSVLCAGWNQIRSTVPARLSHLRVAIAVSIAVLLLTGLRCIDIVNNRPSLHGDSISSFGTGISWWFPEKALDFVARERLPAQVFNGYEYGGFLVWMLGPEYRDYVDSRAIPFGNKLFTNLKRVMDARADSELWRQTADAYRIHTVVFSLARYDGLGNVSDSLLSYCSSPVWRPVYLDEVSAVFVERTPQTENLIARYPLDCATAPIPGESYSQVSDAEFNRWANASALLLALNRLQESLVAGTKALAIYPNAPLILYIRARAEVSLGQTHEAEQDLTRSASLDDREYTWMLLLDLYRAQGRITEAVQAMDHIASNSPQPARILVQEGSLYLETKQLENAAQAFDRAEAAVNKSTDKQTLAAIAHGRATMWILLQNLARATSFEEKAVQIAPNETAYWSQLAQLYAQQGRTADAAQAQQHAEAAGNTNP
jgi:Tfp pilus assembly protein PilF